MGRRLTGGSSRRRPGGSPRRHREDRHVVNREDHYVVNRDDHHAFDEDAKPAGQTGHLLISHPLPEHLEEVLDDHVSNNAARDPPHLACEQTPIVG